MRSQAASLSDLRTEVALTTQRAVARAAALTIRAAEITDLARQLADDARAGVAAAHAKAACVEERAADRGLGDVEEHRRRAAEHRVAVLKAALQLDWISR